MNKVGISIAVAGCLMGLAQLAPAQSKQKPGLWETTSSVSLNGQGMPQVPQGAQAPQNVQLPPGVTIPQGGAMAQRGGPMGPHTTQVCVTQAMIDKYGGPYQNPPRGDCQVSNVAVKPNGMTADLACSGQMTATGTVVATWTDGNSTETTMHMSGTMQMGQNSRPMDVTVHSTSVFKGPDCGSVKPLDIPVSK
jgi:hypothetical protein